jgi:hypothetical protein
MASSAEPVGWQTSGLRVRGIDFLVLDERRSEQANPQRNILRVDIPRVESIFDKPVGAGAWKNGIRFCAISEPHRAALGCS